MTWMQSRDGHAIDLLTPDLSEVSIDEIAHALARISRFCGHTKTVLGYSVAQHSVMVSDHLEESAEYRDLAFWGLMHDAHEAIMGDITSPVKAALKALGGREALLRMETGLLLAVRLRFGAYGGLGELVDLDEDRVIAAQHELSRVPESVKAADLWALATERMSFLGEECKPWNLKVDGEPVVGGPGLVTCWDTATAEREFMRTFLRLQAFWKDRFREKEMERHA